MLRVPGSMVDPVESYLSVGHLAKFDFSYISYRILNKSNIPISDLEKLATDRDSWRSACASGLSTLCQVSD